MKSNSINSEDTYVPASKGEIKEVIVLKEIDSNREAWSKISEDHYHTFKAQFLNGNHKLNYYIESELRNI